MLNKKIYPSFLFRLFVPPRSRRQNICQLKGTSVDTLKYSYINLYIYIYINCLSFVKLRRLKLFLKKCVSTGIIILQTTYEQRTIINKGMYPLEMVSDQLMLKNFYSLEFLSSLFFIFTVPFININIRFKGCNKFDSPETLRKLCLSTKFPHQEIR